MARARGTSNSTASRSRGRRGVARTPRGSQGRKIKPKDTTQIEEPEDRTFVRPSAISPHLNCIICTEVFDYPMRAPCGHSFCKRCIRLWLEKSSTCPADRQHVTWKLLHHDFILESIIGDYTVACPWRSLGCAYIGPLCKLVHHKKECVCNPELLPEPLKVRELQTLVRANAPQLPYPSYRPLLQPSPSTSTVITTSEPSVVVRSAVETVNETFVDITASEEETEDDDELLPPAPQPSLVMRLYQKSDQGARELLCDLFAPTIAQSSASGNQRKMGNL